MQLASTQKKLKLLLACLNIISKVIVIVDRFNEPLPFHIETWNNSLFVKPNKSIGENFLYRLNSIPAMDVVDGQKIKCGF